VSRAPIFQRPLAALAVALLTLSLTFAAAAAARPFLYTTDNASVSLSQFDTSGGLLSPIGPSFAPIPPVGTGDSPGGAAVTNDGLNVYVANGGGGTISQYDADPITGALTPQASPTITTGATPLGVLAISSGIAASLYVADSGASTIHQYDIGVGGVLAAKTTATVASGLHPQMLATAVPGGLHTLYATNLTDGTVSQYSINGTTGELTSLGTALSTGSGTPLPRGIAATPDNARLYVVNTGGTGSIAQFDINPTTGELTAVPAGAITTGLSQPQEVVANDSGVYVTNKGDNTISQYNVDAGTGQLTSKTPATVPTGGSPVGLSSAHVSAGLDHVYAVNTTDKTVSQYNADPTTGVLSPFTPATLPTGANPATLAVAQGAIYGYVTNTDDKTVSQFDFNETSGRLRASTLPTFASSNGQPFGIAASPDGKSVYATTANTTGATDEGFVLQYDVTSTGVLSPKSPGSVSFTGEPAGVAVSADSRSVYVADKGGSTLRQFDADPATGTLTPKAAPTVSTGAAPTGVAISPDGKSVYVTNADDNTVSQYDVDAGTGALTEKSGPPVATGEEPSGVAVSKDSKSVYVTFDNTLDKNVRQYDAAADGHLTPKATPSVATGGGPNGVAVNYARASVYVVNEDDSMVSQFDVSSSGDLTPKTPATVATAANPENVVVSPDGGSVYVSAQGDNGVSQFDVSPSGALTPRSTPFALAGANTIGLALSPPIGPPTVSLGAPVDGSTVAFGDVVHATYSCSETVGGPGLQSCTGTVPDGTPIDTSTAGAHQFTVTATSKAGQTASATSTYTVSAPVVLPPPTPALSLLRVSPSAFVAVKGKGASIAAKKKRKPGAIVSYRDSLAATTTFTVYRSLRGHRVKGGKCSTAPVKKGRKRGKACTRLVRKGTFTHVDRAGANRFRFTGRVKSRPLAPGKYVVTAVPRTALAKGKQASAKFRIKSR
jgi:6-phosphogluconolactonase